MVFIAATLLSGAGFAAGFWVGRKKPQWRRVLLPICAAAIMFRAWLYFTRPMDALLFSFDGYAAVESWWVYPFGAALFGSAGAHLKSPSARNMLLVAQGLAAIYFGMLVFLESFTDLDALYGTVDSQGACRQTSPFSCGPAAATSFLYSYDIPAHEREMAYACWTSENLGTTYSGMVRGLGRKFPEGRSAVSVGHLNITQLQALRRPVLVILETSVVNHWIVVDEVQSDTIRVRDPAGRKSIPRKDFEALWTGLAVWIKRVKS